MPRGPNTRENLLEATVAVAAAEGYARATTRAIAERAGVSEATIYRHFPDKISLFIAAVMQNNEDIEEWFAGFPRRAGEATVAQNLSACLHKLATLKHDVLPLELAMLLDPELARARAERFAATEHPPGPPTHIAEYLAAEQDLGRIRPDCDPHRTALVLMAVLFTAAIGAGPTIDDCVTAVVYGIASPLPLDA